ncbi:hypothetical protein [Pseudoduganella rhizocola]|uniref:hypothetical protein n=1 Tax=Pseudoduganella rhizocola TaxID=3382643 RepID=UPI0038B42743
MKVHTLRTPSPELVSRSIQVNAALKARRTPQSNVWFFDSPKNNTRLSIETDLAFMHLVLLEGDPSVVRYWPVQRGEYNLPAAAGTSTRIDRRDGSQEWWHFKRVTRTERRAATAKASERNEVRDAAQSAGAVYLIKTDTDLRDEVFRFDNWLTLCAAMTRCRGHFLGHEMDRIAQRLDLQDAVTLKALLTLEDADPALMLAAVARALQAGAIATELKLRRISYDSLIMRQVS